MAGMKIVTVGCDANGNIDVEDLKAKAQEHSSELACMMITYPLSLIHIFASRMSVSIAAKSVCTNTRAPNGSTISAARQ